MSIFLYRSFYMCAVAGNVQIPRVHSQLPLAQTD